MSPFNSGGFLYQLSNSSHGPGQPPSVSASSALLVPIVTSIVFGVLGVLLIRELFYVLEPLLFASSPTSETYVERCCRLLSKCMGDVSAADTRTKDKLRRVRVRLYRLEQFLIATADYSRFPSTPTELISGVPDPKANDNHPVDSSTKDYNESLCHL